MIQYSRPLRIILADPPVKEEHYFYYQPTMGILYLLGAIKNNFYSNDVEVYYLQGFGNLKEHLNAIQELRPDIYGISFKTPMAHLGYKTINAVREKFPNLIIIAGGAHVSVLAEEVMKKTSVDACFRGECENTIVKFVNDFKSGKHQYDNLPGVVYRSPKSIIYNTLDPFEPNLDKYSWPAWEMIDINRYPGMPYKKISPYLGVVVSRGCPFECIFCSEPVWKIFGRPTYRTRTPEKIVEEIEYLYKRGVREIRLWCEELNIDNSWAIELLERIAALNHHELFLNCNIRGDNITESMAKALKAANVWLVCIGMESSSDRVLNGLDKRVTKEQLENSCNVLISHDIKISGYFQFYSAWEEDGEICWETPIECSDTISWALNLSKNDLLHYMNTSIATPRPGTPLWTYAMKYNLLKTHNSEDFPYLQEGMNLPDISSSQIRKTLIYSNYAKVKIGLKNGNINFRTIPDFLIRNTRRLIHV